MEFSRASGILLHPTSLPGPYGIGDLGPEAYQWIDFLAESQCTLWQVLPLGPTGYGDSPYQCFSAFAGNPYLVSPFLLYEEGLLQTNDLSQRPAFPENAVDYGAVIPWKLGLLDRAFQEYEKNPAPWAEEFERFKNEQAYWLDDFALFMALKTAHQGAPWNKWDPAFRQRHPQALAEFKEKNSRRIDSFKFSQFLFFRQWNALRDYAHSKGIQIIGDIPIFVSYDSSDVWANPNLFYLDTAGNPTVVAGVPPDYFSPTGQLWGNPLYRWDYHAQEGYSWWIERVRSTLQLVDIIRLDHFRGFAAYWEVPAGNPTAEKGQWVSGPGLHFFEAVQKALGDLPFIAEDLGVITPDVVALRERFGFPGMKILQFGFEGGPEDPFLPHNYEKNCVAYTGTHDNDTARGWYNRVDEKARDYARRYLACADHDIAWYMIRAIWSSVAIMALAPMQDVLNLGNEARMNYPGRPYGNWTWRMKSNDLNPALSERLAEINYIFRRDSSENSPQPSGEVDLQPN